MKKKSIISIILIVMILTMSVPLTAYAEGTTCAHTNTRHVDSVPSTCETEGIREHDVCLDCGAKIMMGYIVSDYQIKQYKLYHNWIYSVVGNTITAACTRKAECKKTDVKISIHATNDYYTAQKYTGITLDADQWTTNGFFEPEVYYTGRDGTDYRETTRPPVEVGKYTAKIFVGNSPSATADFEIKEVPQGKLESISTESGVVKNITNESVQNEMNQYDVKILNSSELERLISITPEEKTKGVNVWVSVTDAESSMSWEDKEKIGNAVLGGKVGLYFDISLLKRTGVSEAEKVTETNGRIKLSITIPEDLRQSNREYKIIRVHDGQVSVLDGNYDDETGIFSFETDRFSSYALVYTEDSANVPKSGDSSNYGCLATLMLLSIGLAYIAINSKRKVNK